MHLSATVFTLHEPISVKPFLREYHFLTLACASLLEVMESRLKLLKSTFNVETFMCRLSKFISSHFGAIHF